MSEQASAGNLIQRHWRGELPLVHAYWVIGVALSLALAALGAVLGLALEATGERLGARGVGAVLLAFIAFTALLTLWQTVGIWRSADKHEARGGNRYWGWLAKLAVVLSAGRSANEIFEALREVLPLMQ